MNDLSPAQMLATIRLAIGAGAWTAPKVTGVLFGFKMLGEPEAVYLGRLFGIRDVALGAGALASGTEGRRLWLQLGVVCDAADAAAGVLAFRGGAPKRGSVLATATALLATGLGVAALSAAK